MEIQSTLGQFTVKQWPLINLISCPPWDLISDLEQNFQLQSALIKPSHFASILYQLKPIHIPGIMNISDASKTGRTVNNDGKVVHIEISWDWQILHIRVLGNDYVTLSLLSRDCIALSLLVQLQMDY